MMAKPAGEPESDALRLDFDRRLKLEFHGSGVTSDAGLLAYRELDDALGLMAIVGQNLVDGRTGRNGRHDLVGMLRQSVFGRLAGYEDVNDADRLGRDPAMRWVVGGKAVERAADGWKDVLEPVVARYRERDLRRYFRADAAFANPEVYEFLEAESYKYTIRLPANRILQDRIGYLLKRPVGRPPITVRRYYASFSYQAASWTMPRRVVAKVEWYLGKLYPRVGFIVTNLSRRAERVVAFYNRRGMCEQWIKEGKNAIKWTRLSRCSFAANAVRLQLHALAYNLANTMRTLALPEAVAQWSLTSLREKLVKIGAKVVRHARCAVFQMAEVAVPIELFEKILRLIDGLRPQPAPP
jgi:hypothetical protein